MNALVPQREALCRAGHSLHARGLTHGSTGNLSLRIDNGWLMTPTGSSLGALDPARLSWLDSDGQLIDGDPPTKEAGLHLALYRARETSTAVVHLHSIHAVAVSVLADIDPRDVLLPLTAYYVMRVGTLPLLPFFPPGDRGLAETVARFAAEHPAMLLANHGPLVAGSSLASAVDAIEEIEATARLQLLLHGRQVRPLNQAQVLALRERFAK